jgi:hypothetical protein
MKRSVKAVLNGLDPEIRLASLPESARESLAESIDDFLTYPPYDGHVEVTLQDVLSLPRLYLGAHD